MHYDTIYINLEKYANQFYILFWTCMCTKNYKILEESGKHQMQSGSYHSGEEERKM